MRSAIQRLAILTVLALLLGTAPSSRAFSLLGPYAPWMQKELLEVWQIIGGPMEIDQGYRWNVPFVTYGFTPAFIEFFGPEGVAAVEAAAAKINALPPASQIELTNVATDLQRVNNAANAQSLLSLESRALAVFSQSLGVGPANRLVYSVFGRFETNWIPFEPDYPIIVRNYDLVTGEPTFYINGTLYNYWLVTFPDLMNLVIAWPITSDPLGWFSKSAADPERLLGEYLEGIPREDAGAIRHLLIPTNRKIEPLLPDVIAWPPVQSFGGIPVPNSLVSQAERPGVDKVELVRFDPSTNLFGRVFEDYYFSNGVLHTQMVARVLSKPDILFDARDLGLRRADIRYMSFRNLGFEAFSPVVNASNVWINCSALNNSTNGEGPGIIGPGLEIVFNTLSAYAQTNTGAGPIDLRFGAYLWGSFDGSTNPPVRLGAKTNLPPRALFFETTRTNEMTESQWGLIGKIGAIYHIDISTNLTDWTLLETVTNTDTVVRIRLTNDFDAQFLRLRED